MPVITLPDGSQRTFSNPVTIADVAADIGPGLAKAALAAGAVDGKEKARNDLLARYVQSIKARVASNWAHPPTTPKGLKCRVRVKQIPGGGVVDASISTPCNADALVKKSIINAVKRSDPLPYTGFEDVFERTLSFTFTYDGEN